MESKKGVQFGKATRRHLSQVTPISSRGDTKWQHGDPTGRRTGGVTRQQTHPTRLVTPEGVGGFRGTLCTIILRQVGGSKA